MSRFDVSELVPGIVVRLDTRRLRALGGSETNAQRTDTEDRAVTETHDFLIVARDAKSDVCLAVPLFARSSPGSAPLVATKRAGDVGSWLTEDVHYSRWQHWRMPASAMVDASDSDPGDEGNRRSFALGDADILQDLANWATRNRCAFRTA
ncbi:MAG: hypothetical protein JWM95_968 [Gemmatimonadetes bacterium]|nr:hypothetical protein [Gemmatimonadota bacterium]